jgi:hypothetical protein
MGIRRRTNAWSLRCWINSSAAKVFPRLLKRYTKFENGSDHRAIETTFDVATPKQVVEARSLFKNAPWNDIRTRINSSLRSVPIGGSVMVDNRPHAAPASLHVLEEPGENSTTDGSHVSEPSLRTASK